ncbi:hypothetical protein D3C87_1545330 [compost metagenome]
MKATLKKSSPFSTPLKSGMIASRMETAPRRPTQATKPISCWVKSKGSRLSQTAMGRATKMRKSARPIAGRRMAGNCDGVASRPRTRNMMIWASQVSPSLKRMICCLAYILRFPAYMPAT